MSHLLTTRPTGGKVELLLERAIANAGGDLPASREPSAQAGRRAAAAGRRARDGAGARRTVRPVAPRTGSIRSSITSSATARCRCRRTSRARPPPPTRRATRPSTRGMPGAAAAPDRRPAFRRRRCSPRSRRAGIASRVRHAARGRRNVPAGRDRGPRRSTGCTRSGTAFRRRPSRRSTPRARAAAASSRSARPACARSNRRPTTRDACAPAKRETRLFITPGYRFRVVERLAHQLPPAEVDAADARVGVRRPREHPRRVRARDRASAIASSATATRCCSSASRRQPGATACYDCRDALHAARDVGPRAARPARRSRTAPSRRRCSCPSAPTARSRRMAPNELALLGAQIVLGNTYHLWLRPGIEVIAAHRRAAPLHGLARARSSPTPAASRCGACGPLRKVREDGVTFASPVDGDRLLLTPEISMQIQRALGADIAMVFDECTPYPATPRRGARRRWSCRCAGRARSRDELDARRQPERAVRHRAGRHVSTTCATRRSRGSPSIGFDGYAIGGLSVGEPKDEMLAVLDAHGAAAAGRPAALPDGRRHARATSSRGVARGVDMFDCVLPTRNARNGHLFTRYGDVKIRNAAHRDGHAARSTPRCACYTCAALHARLPAPPAARERDPRRPPQHDPQSPLLPVARRRDARGHRRRAASTPGPGNSATTARKGHQADRRMVE